MVSHDSTSRPPSMNIIQHLKNYYIDSKVIRNNDIVIKVYDKITLGKGGYGLVLYGTLTNKKKSQKHSVAVKTINMNHSSSHNREEAALTKIKHPNVVRLYHVTSSNDFRYKYLHGFSKKKISKSQ